MIYFWFSSVVLSVCILYILFFWSYLYVVWASLYILFLSFCFNAFLHRACTYELFKLSYTISQFWLLICQRSSIEYFSPVFKHNYASSGVAEFFLYLFIYWDFCVGAHIFQYVCLTLMYSAVLFSRLIAFRWMVFCRDEILYIAHLQGSFC